jgi:F-type H+-transporting ATPase subunit b
MNKVPALVLSAAIILAGITARAEQPPQVPSPEATQERPVAAETLRDAHEPAAEEHHGVFEGLLWPVVNFTILFGGLWWLLKRPLAGYLRDRHSAIRQDLTEAAQVKAAAAAHLAEIDRKLAALPGEIVALRARGAEEIAAEEQRIAEAAAAERERLLEQTRREIDVQLRLAKRELLEHAADLAVQVAGARIQQQMTSPDQERLVDRYLDQMKGGSA